jgi:hypothetical protein
LARRVPKSSGSQLVPPQLSELILRNNRLSSINACVDDMQQYVHLKRLDSVAQRFQECAAGARAAHRARAPRFERLRVAAGAAGRLVWLQAAVDAAVGALRQAGRAASVARVAAGAAGVFVLASERRGAACARRRCQCSRGDADDVEKAEDDGGYVPSRHCVGAICDADAMRARFQYNISLRVLGGAPHPLAGAMLAGARGGRRQALSAQRRHQAHALVCCAPDACAAESEPFRVVAADFVGRTMSLLARDEQFRDRLVQDDSLALLLLLAENKHHGVVSECAVALTSLCGFAHEPQLVADARATVTQAIDPASVAATSPAAQPLDRAGVAAAASTPTATADRTPAPTVQSERDLALAAASRALATWAPRIVNAMLVNHAGNARVAQGAMMALYFLSQRDKACELVGKSPEAPALFHFLVNAGLSPAHHTGSFLALQTLNNFAFSNHRQLASGDYRLFERIRECLAID